MKITESEKIVLKELYGKIRDLQYYFKTEQIDEHSYNSIHWYNYIVKIKKILGNFDNDISYIACLMAKEFLISRHSVEDLDVSLKPQSAPGLDIDTITNTGDRIIAEIKTTIPYLKNDLGAQQKNMFLKDFHKLNNNDATFKYFIVTEKAAYNVVQKRYSKYLNNKILVLLPNALIDKRYIIEYDKFKNDKILECSSNNILTHDQTLTGKFSQADSIRKFIFDYYIRPARKNTKNIIKIRSGDIQKEMGLINRYPAVCSAMRGKKIEEIFKIEIAEIDGRVGSNFYVTYRIR